MNLYLSSTESADFEKPRSLFDLKKMIIDSKVILKANIKPSLVFHRTPIDEKILKDSAVRYGKQYGPGEHEIKIIYLADRIKTHEDRGIAALKIFPIDVYVFIPKHPNINTPTLLDQLDLVAWATLYDSETAAKKHNSL